jgi:hypothetical protein
MEAIPNNLRILLNRIIENDMTLLSTWSSVKMDIINWIYRENDSDFYFGKQVSVTQVYEKIFDSGNLVDNCFKINFTNLHICTNCNCSENGIEKKFADYDLTFVDIEEQLSFHKFDNHQRFESVAHLFSSILNNVNNLKNTSRSKCKICKQNCSSKSTILKYPFILTIATSKTKVTKIENELILNNGNCKYKLKALAISLKASAKFNGGHYYAKIRNDFNDYVITNDNKYHKLTNDLNNFKDYIYRNDMNIKYYILILYSIIFIDFLY